MRWNKLQGIREREKGLGHVARRGAIMALAMAGAAGSAGATTVRPEVVTYALSGSAITGCTGKPLFCYFTPPFSQNNGKIWIDERLLPSRSLVSRTLTFSYSSLDPLGNSPYLEAIRFGTPYRLDSGVEGTFTLTTDENRAPLSWAFQIRGVPSGRGSTGDFHHDAAGMVYGYAGFQVWTGPGGSLALRPTPAPVPLPATATLLLAAMALLGLGLPRRKTAG